LGKKVSIRKKKPNQIVGAMQPMFKQIIKCTLIGDDACGKSCFMNRWDKQDEYVFNPGKYERTIGVEFAVKIVSTPNNSTRELEDASVGHNRISN
jgi:GTPase SAR1 family protein